MFGFPIMKPSFSFANVNLGITIPAACLVNNSGLLSTINVVLERIGRN